MSCTTIGDYESKERQNQRKRSESKRRAVKPSRNHWPFSIITICKVVKNLQRKCMWLFDHLDYNKAKYKFLMSSIYYFCSMYILLLVLQLQFRNLSFSKYQYLSDATKELDDNWKNVAFKLKMTMQGRVENDFTGNDTTLTWFAWEVPAPVSPSYWSSGASGPCCCWPYSLVRP